MLNQKKKDEINSQIEFGNNRLAFMNNVVNNNIKMYTRSFPLNRMSSQTEYQIWLTQMAEFCDMKSPVISIGNYQTGPGIATQKFQLKSQCSTEQLYQFLYEFYWTSYLHRITSLNIQPVEQSSDLDVNIVFETLTLAKVKQTDAYPLAQQLPISTPIQRLSSKPFKAYAEIAKKDIFRYIKPGIDNANFAILTGTPSVTDEATGKNVAVSRWKIQTENRTMNLKIGDSISIGSFDGKIADIFEDMVIIKQNNGSLWVVALGEKLSDATAVPAFLF
ncbi:MAG: hypothetical protein Q4C95_11000 [Planctomycetia bacterium]|nr:hypothetical protein [Planctomycetia bacterium]